MIGRTVRLLLVAACLSAAHLAHGVEITDVRVGFADRYKVGLFTPVVLTLRGGDEAFEGEAAVIVPDGDGVPTRFATDPAHPVRVPPEGEAEARLYVRFGRVNSTLRADLSAGGQTVASRVLTTAETADASHFLPALQSQPLLVVVGDAPQGIEEAADLQNAAAERAPVVVSFKDARGLPDRWYGYEGVDWLVLSTSSADAFPADAGGQDVVAAMRGWVEQGGQMLLCGGAGAGELLREGGPLYGLAPGKYVKDTPLRQTAAVESYCRSSVPVPKLSGKPLVATQLDDLCGVVEAQEGKLAMVVNRALGSGHVVFFAAALDRAPLALWKDRPLLAARLLGLPVSPVDETHEGSAVMHFGYDDLAGQLRSALDRFRGVGVASFSLVAILILAYIAVVGPADYYLLRRFGRRMGLTWVTFPLVVLAFCALAAGLTHSLRGNSVRIHQVDLIDADLGAKQLHGTSWFNLYSPRAGTFDLSVRPKLPQSAHAAGSLVTWMGLPGDALGGMNPKGAQAAVASAVCKVSPQLDALTGVPIAAGATKSFTARWSAAGTGLVDAKLSLQDDLPTGEVMNLLDVPLRHCLLAYRHWVFELGDLEPGEAVAVGATTRRSELQTLLTGRRLVMGDGKTSTMQVATPYDAESADAASIVRMMSFYQAVGGRHYTGLANEYQRFVDATPALGGGAAVLFATIPPEAKAPLRTEVLCGGEPFAQDNAESAVLYRAFIPVAPAAKP